MFDSPSEVEPLDLEFEQYKTESRPVDSFDCGNAELNDFLCTDEVEKYERELFGRTWLVFYKGELVAYYTVSNGSLRIEYLKSHRGFSNAGEYHINSIPSLIVGRLAVDKRWQKKGIGRTIMAKIAAQAYESSETAGLRLIVVQAEKEAINFYDKLGFVPVFETREEKRRFKSRHTRTMFLDLLALSDIA